METENLFLVYEVKYFYIEFIKTIVIDASRASLGVRRSDLDIVAGAEWPGLMDAHLRQRLDMLISRSGLNVSMSDVPVGLSEAQINRLPRTKATAIQCSGNSKFYSLFYISVTNIV